VFAYNLKTTDPGPFTLYFALLLTVTPGKLQMYWHPSKWSPGASCTLPSSPVKALQLLRHVPETGNQNSLRWVPSRRLMTGTTGVELRRCLNKQMLQSRTYQFVRKTGSFVIRYLFY